MKQKIGLIILMIFSIACTAVKKETVVSTQQMQRVFEQVKTPYKYGVVFSHPDSTKMMDSPSIFRWKGSWYMSYIIFDGKGYETWLAQSDDLLHWTTKGRIMSFTNEGWDANQKAGYLSLIDTKWGGSYQLQSFKEQYWLSYLGGSITGYEAGRLGIGMAHTDNPTKASEWTRFSKPVLAANDTGARWFEQQTIYKSVVIKDKLKLTGRAFAMFYNAKGDTANFESIGVATSNDLEHWKRVGKNPVISQYQNGTICGDAQITKMGNLYTLFYFGAFWDNKPYAFDRFACSYDLIHWTNWTGEDLIKPSEPYDSIYAHKPFVLKWKGVVYHFYTAVGNAGRVIALATSKPLN